MKENQFRGLSLKTHQWVYGYYVEANENTHWIVQMNCYGELLRGDTTQVIPETVGQFTGLKDKNSVKIFEGDIVKKPSGTNHKIVWIGDRYGLINGGTFLGVEHATYEVTGKSEDRPLTGKDHCCECWKPATKLCDHVVNKGNLHLLCSKPLCEDHAFTASMGIACKRSKPNKGCVTFTVDYCPEHANEHKRDTIMKECECKDWASNDVRFVNMYGHHASCCARPSQLKQFRMMLDIIKSLTDGMEAWSKDEDGIHPDTWEAYKKAKMILGEDCDESTA